MRNPLLIGSGLLTINGIQSANNFSVLVSATLLVIIRIGNR